MKRTLSRRLGVSLKHASNRQSAWIIRRARLEDERWTTTKWKKSNFARFRTQARQKKNKIEGNLFLIMRSFFPLSHRPEGQAGKYRIIKGLLLIDSPHLAQQELRSHRLIIALLVVSVEIVRRSRQCFYTFLFGLASVTINFFCLQTTSTSSYNYHPTSFILHPTCTIHPIKICVQYWCSDNFIGWSLPRA